MVRISFLLEICYYKRRVTIHSSTKTFPEERKMEPRIAQRNEKAIAAFKEYGISALLLTKAEDVHYFTGLKVDECYVLLTEDKKYMVTDFRYEEEVSVLKPEFDIIITKQGYELMDFVKEVMPEKLGVQDETLTMSQYKQLREFLADEAIIGITGLTETIRFYKDEYELECIKKAVAIGDKAFAHILEFIKPGMTEKEVALEIEHHMMLNGADGIAFETICVSGKNSSLPHGHPSEKVIEEGDFLTMDYGCKVGGYCSDMTRTIAIGYATDEMKEIYDLVLRAQLNACEKLGPNMHVKEGDALARDIISEAGYGPCFGHGLGHGVGLEIHEDPWLSFRGVHMLEPGMIMTIEPGVYLPGKFGVRIEDTVCITEDGIDIYCTSPKELIIINNK